MKIGFQEIIIVFIVALVVLGPDKMPYYARKLGEALKQFRKYSSEATKDIREGIVEPLQEAQKPLKEALEPVTELQKTVRNEVNGLKRSITDSGAAQKTMPAASEEAAKDTDMHPQEPGTEEAVPVPEQDIKEEVSS